MAQKQKDKARWSAHVQAVLDALGWDATRLSTEAELLTGDPEAITYKTANNWWAARAVPGADGATIFAEATGTDLVLTLRESSHPALADAVARLQAGAPPRRPEDPPKVDPYLRDLMADPGFASDNDRAFAIDLYMRLEKDFDETQARDAARSAAAEAARALGRSIAERRNSA
jgi:hypothetical protein